MKIQELKLDVQSKLESGLTITDPAQCVIELVQNSLDAKATAIAVRVNLEKYSIEVVDNGTGILPNDLNLVGTRFMTSKCNHIDDLNKNLFVYGYRGQALASIIEVCSTLKIKTRSRISKDTLVKVFRNGKPFPIFASNGEKSGTGTTVTVYEFMSCLPVRRKRISKVFDLPEIKHQLEYLALVHYQVCFTLRDEKKGEIILQTHKMADCISSFTNLFGLGLDKFLVPVNYAQKDIEIQGFISLKRHFENNLQFVYVNKRIISKGIVHKLLNKLINNYARENFNVGSESYLVDDINLNISNDLHNIYVIQIQCPYALFEIFRNMRKTTVEFNDWDYVLKCIRKAFKSVFVQKKPDIEANGAPTEMNANYNHNPLIRKTDQEYLKNGIRGAPVRRKFPQETGPSIKLKKVKLFAQDSSCLLNDGDPQGMEITNEYNVNDAKMEVLNNLMDCSLLELEHSARVVSESPIPAEYSWNVLKKLDLSNLNSPKISSRQKLKIERFRCVKSLFDFAIWFKSKVKCDFKAFKIYNEFIQFQRNRRYLSKGKQRASASREHTPVIICESEENKRAFTSDDITMTKSKPGMRYNVTLNGKEKKVGVLTLRDKLERAGKQFMCRMKKRKNEITTATNACKKRTESRKNSRGKRTRKTENLDKLNAERCRKYKEADDENILIRMIKPTERNQFVKVTPPSKDDVIRCEKTVPEQSHNAENVENASLPDVDIATKSWSSHYRHRVNPHRIIPSFDIVSQNAEECSLSGVNGNSKNSFASKKDIQCKNRNSHVPLRQPNSGVSPCFQESLEQSQLSGVLNDKEFQKSFTNDAGNDEIPAVTIDSPVVEVRRLYTNEDFGSGPRENQLEVGVRSPAFSKKNESDYYEGLRNDFHLKLKQTICCKGMPTDMHSASVSLSSSGMASQESKRKKKKLINSCNSEGSQYVKSLGTSDNIKFIGVSKGFSQPMTSFDEVGFLGVRVTNPLMDTDSKIGQDPYKLSCAKNRQIMSEGNISKIRKDECFSYDVPDTLSIHDEMNDNSASFVFTERYSFIPKGLSQTVLDKSPTHVDKRSNFVEEGPDIYNNRAMFCPNKGSEEYATSLLLSNVVDDLRQIAKENMIHYESELLVSTVTKSASKIDNFLKSFVMDKGILSNFKIVGQWDKKFVLAVIAISFPENMKLLAIFDQHAVDERIRLEKLLRECRDCNGKFICCPCNPPIKCKLNGSITSFIPALQDVLIKYGVKVSIFDSETILLHEIPICVAGENIKNENTETIVRNLVRDVIEEFSETRGTTAAIPKVLYSLLSTKACKSAVKFNKALSAHSMEDMINDLVNCQVPFLCAHGRPSILPVLDLEAFENQVGNLDKWLSYHTLKQDVPISSFIDPFEYH